MVDFGFAICWQFRCNGCWSITSFFESFSIGRRTLTTSTGAFNKPTILWLMCKHISNFYQEKWWIDFKMCTAQKYRPVNMKVDGFIHLSVKVKRLVDKMTTRLVSKSFDMDLEMTNTSSDTNGLIIWKFEPFWWLGRLLYCSDRQILRRRSVREKDQSKLI